MSYNLLPAIPTFAGITSLSFDSTSDLLWLGNAAGILSSYHGHDLARGVCFPVSNSSTDSTGRSAVIKVVATENSIRACSGAGIGAWAKGGANKWFAPSRDLGNPSTIASGGSTSFFASLSGSELVLLSASTGSVTRRVPTLSILRHLHATHSQLVAAAGNGTVVTYDPRTAMVRSSSSIPAHPGGVQGVTLSPGAGTYIYTIGYSMRGSHPVPDPFIRVYDSRKSIRSLASLPFLAGPSFISSLPSPLPTLPDRIVVASDTGVVQLIDPADVDGVTPSETFSVSQYK